MLWHPTPPCPSPSPLKHAGRVPSRPGPVRPGPVPSRSGGGEEGGKGALAVSRRRAGARQPPARCQRCSLSPPPRRWRGGARGSRPRATRRLPGASREPLPSRRRGEAFPEGIARERRGSRSTPPSSAEFAMSEDEVEVTPSLRSVLAGTKDDHFHARAWVSVV